MKALQTLRTAASIYGALLFWVGTWDLLYYWGTCVWYRELGYALTGLVLTAGSDTLAANGAIGEGWMGHPRGCSFFKHARTNESKR